MCRCSSCCRISSPSVDMHFSSNGATVMIQGFMPIRCSENYASAMSVSRSNRPSQSRGGSCDTTEALVLCPLSSFTLSEAAPGSGRGLRPTSPEERGPTVALSNRKAGTDHGTMAGPSHSHGNSGRLPFGKGRKGRSKRCGGDQFPAGANRPTSTCNFLDATRENRVSHTMRSATL